MQIPQSASAGLNSEQLFCECATHDKCQIGDINNNRTRIYSVVIDLVRSFTLFPVYRRAFSMFDYQKVGEIETDKIHTILITLGNPYDEAELERLIRQEDTEGNKNSTQVIVSAAIALLTRHIQRSDGKLCYVTTFLQSQSFLAEEGRNFSNLPPPTLLRFVHLNLHPACLPGQLYHQSSC